MVIFNKNFWSTVLSVVLTLIVECVLTGVFLVIYAAIYYTTGHEPLNSGTPVLFMKGFLILLVSIYNSKKIIASYRAKDVVAAFGYLAITMGYSILIILPSGGGR